LKQKLESNLQKQPMKRNFLELQLSVNYQPSLVSTALEVLKVCIRIVKKKSESVRNKRKFRRNIVR
jgi:hypothetical protein